jgi:1,4-dihydroxy-2-naphthoate octaprenyltransferase
MTLAVRLGRRWTRMEYATFVRLAYLIPPLLWLQGMVGPWSWLPWLSLPLAVPLIRFVEQTEGRALNQALKRTGQLHLVFGLLFAAGVWLP